MSIKEPRPKRKVASGKNRKVHTRNCKTCGNDTPLTLLDNNVCVYCRAEQVAPDLERVAAEDNAEKARTRRLAREKAHRQEMYLQTQQAEKERAQKDAERKAKEQAVFDQQEEARKELARRELAKNHLLPMVMRANPDYLPGWVHKDICEHLEWFSNAVAAGESPRLIINMPPRSGKACALGTLVPTPTGMKAIETLKPGDEVFGRDGKPTSVVAVSPIWRDRELYRVTADDGASVVVDAEHEWTVRLCRKRPTFLNS
jgi:hypothetical protein